MLRLHPGVQARIAAAGTEDERKTDLFRAATADFPDLAFADQLLADLPEIDFNRVVALFEAQQLGDVRLSPRAAYGIVLAVATVLISSVPAVAVERFTQLKADEFDLAAFVVGAGTAVYLSITLLPDWLTRRIQGTAARDALRYLKLAALRQRRGLATAPHD
ncbi:MAG: hypothetical protein IPK85_04235 [Gemmatimonadetes bacterium]|nr:hypothetical protein [Gemmatimonadota bacterium]